MMLLDLNNESRQPLYRLIADSLGRKISSGEIEAGTKLPSDEDMCRSLGVSEGTLQKAYERLTAEDYITRRRGPGGGTFVSGGPKPRRFSDTHSIGLVFYDVAAAVDGYFSCIVRGASEAAKEMGYELHLFGAKGFNVYFGNDLLAESVNQKLIGGLILLSSWSDEEIRMLRRTGCPLTVADVDYTHFVLPHVAIDDATPIRVAAGDLVAEGHRNICLFISRPSMGNPFTVGRGLRMRDGYEAALKEAHLTYNQIIVKHRALEESDSLDEISGELDEALKTATAFICDGDWTTTKLCEYISAKGKTAGKDVVVVNYRDSLNVPGTRSVYKPLFEMGQASARLLDSVIKGVVAVDTVVVQATGERIDTTVSMIEQVGSYV